MKIDEKQLAADAMKQITLEVDMSRVHEAALGYRHWKLSLAVWLITLATLMLGVNLELNFSEETE